MSAAYESKLSEFALKVSRISAHFKKNGKLTELERHLFQQWLSEMYEATLVADFEQNAPNIEPNITFQAPISHEIPTVPAEKEKMSAPIAEQAPTNITPISTEQPNIENEPLQPSNVYDKRFEAEIATAATEVKISPAIEEPLVQVQPVHVPSPSVTTAHIVEQVPAAPVVNEAPIVESPVSPMKVKEEVADEVLSFDPPAAVSTSSAGLSLGLSTDYQKTDLNQRYATQQEGEKLSMNDRLKREAATTISGKLTKGESLNDLIDLNKSFLFRNDLFAGNIEKYQQVIKQIDLFRTHEEALFFLEQIRSSLQITERNKAAWDLFLKTVRLKFQP